MAIIHTNKSLREAVALYLCDKENAIEMYGPINTWNTSEVTDMSKLFENSNFNEDISDWDVSKVEKFNYMFYAATNFNQDLSKWNPKSKQYTISSMFYDASSFTQNIINWPLVINRNSNYIDLDISFMINYGTGVCKDPKLGYQYIDYAHVYEEDGCNYGNDLFD